MFFSAKKNPIVFLSLNPHPTTLTPSPPPPMTCDAQHKPPFLAVVPGHREERFNQSGILRIHLKDSVEKQALNPSFMVSLR